MDINPAYVRQLEDAVLGLFGWMDAIQIAELEHSAPRLVGFVRHLERDMPHEERMMRRNVWAEDGAPND